MGTRTLYHHDVKVLYYHENSMWIQYDIINL